MTTPRIRVSREWLALREAADAAARANDLVERLKRQLPATGRQVIHDLGCGTGAMARWLAPLLSGPQHWILHDLDADLLDVAESEPPGPAADGGCRHARDEASLTSAGCGLGELAGSTLITASALLDILTEEELSALIAICVGARLPVLLTLSVVGRVELTPAEPLDRRVAAAFDAHQRRVTERGRLLGPDAVAVAVEQAGSIGGPRCSSARAPGAWAPRRPNWPRSGSADGWVLPANRRLSLPPRSGRTPADVWHRRPRERSGSPSTTPTS